MEKKQLHKLLEQMTVEEKIGQLVQLTPNFFEETDGEGEITGPLMEWGMSKQELYNIGSVLGTHTISQTHQIQAAYLKNNRLGIPLLFMADVIHGYETIFPIPIALASSWSPELIEEMASLSAVESAEAGVHVTFSPMADLVRDPRWGRVMESSGEDTYLNSLLTAAYVRGYQGNPNKLNENFNKIAACVKHFIGYGASEAGRDYNTVDFSDLALYQDHLPSFEAALNAGAKLVMTSFNTIKGIPASGSQWLLKEVLRNDLNFQGLLISDWAAIAEMITHGVAVDKKEAALKALSASVDMDMMTDCYQSSLKELLKEGKITETTVDQAVLHVLQLKNDLGLFEDPYRGMKGKQQKAVTFSDSIQSTARELAAQSMVLLKNEHLLPLNSKKTVALIGPKAASQDILGAWSWIGKQSQAVTLKDALKKEYPDLLTAETDSLTKITSDEWETIKRVAAKADIVILALGESSEESGEAASKATIRLPEAQEQLVKSIKAINPNIVTVLFNGRPLVLEEIAENSSSLLEAWFPGTQGGPAIVDILVGRVNPSAKLPMSFPRNTGQIPIYYNHMSTGRPVTQQNKQEKYISKYIDVANEPLYPFGYGLTYTSFIIEDIKVSSTQLTEDTKIIITVNVTNIGRMIGKEIIQLYLHDVSAEVVRPVKELKKFRTVLLEPNQMQEVKFEITVEDLVYIHPDLKKSADKGFFEIFIGTESRAPKITEIEYV
ncbi:glycoside hydrolase family 3 N-terminal domain-containing protein [Jeotgalibaca caeni]|uniref:glycoside hydrolase family 3 N-terminal domain-containing protein n=1 Tax=Jeotgalibaca caeni TaxID=3028623 RepID=UPI00237E0834|nr:glycoside hydrolase family 3 N-terminal domain-containing protein [Jeotgalibaca caeni]MDE1549701.1 glycoside hydrolase family 3 N-terminal domain-containing protein [Jeotgalibaca caeni]